MKILKNLILHYLREPDDTYSLQEDTDIKLATEEYYQQLNDNLANIENTESFENSAVFINPFPGIGQIWLCKQYYFDRLGKKIEGRIPYYVLIVDGPNILADLEFVRVQPISPFTEFNAKDDVVIDDERITGFKFFVEAWNEQPIEISLLDNYIGNLDIKEQKSEQYICLSNEQKEFRELEIKNTAYLRQSILLYLSENEKTNFEIRNLTLYLSAVAAIFFILFLIWQPQKLSDNQIITKYSLAISSPYSLDTVKRDLNLRGDECEIENLTSEECLLAGKALAFYEKKEYEKASQILSELLMPKEKSNELVFFLAVAQLKSAQSEYAIQNLQYLSNLKNYKFGEEANYYLALAHIENRERAKARQLLKKIKNETGIYAKDASRILEDLRWF